MKYYYAAKMAKLKRTMIQITAEGAEQLQFSCTVGENAE